MPVTALPVTCRECGSEVPAHTVNCVSCGADQTNTVEVVCEVVWRLSGFRGKFTTIRSDDRGWSEAVGGPLRRPSRLVTPSRSQRSLSALAALVVALEREGWERFEKGGEWYSHRFRRLETAPHLLSPAEPAPAMPAPARPEPLLTGTGTRAAEETVAEKAAAAATVAEEAPAAKTPAAKTPPAKTGAAKTAAAKTGAAKAAAAKTAAAKTPTAKAAAEETAVAKAVVEEPAVEETAVAMAAVEETATEPIHAEHAVSESGAEPKPAKRAKRRRGKQLNDALLEQIDGYSYADYEGVEVRRVLSD